MGVGECIVYLATNCGAAGVTETEPPLGNYCTRECRSLELRLWLGLCLNCFLVVFDACFLVVADACKGFNQVCISPSKVGTLAQVHPRTTYKTKEDYSA